MTKKVHKQKLFLFVITQNLNWEISTKNLATVKRFIKKSNF